VTCGINNPTLLQSQFEAGLVSWGVTVGAAAKGSNSTVSGDYSTTFDKVLTQVRQYQLGIKRVELNSDGGTAAVITTGGLWSSSGSGQPSWQVVVLHRLTQGQRLDLSRPVPKATHCQCPAVLHCRLCCM
jgi:hypothetical protein